MEKLFKVYQTKRRSQKMEGIFLIEIQNWQCSYKILLEGIQKHLWLLVFHLHINILMKQCQLWIMQLGPWILKTNQWFKWINMNKRFSQWKLKRIDWDLRMNGWRRKLWLEMVVNQLNCLLIFWDKSHLIYLLYLERKQVHEKVS